MGYADMPAFGILLREFREQAGLTQEELAERAGLSTDAIGLLERGERQRPQRATVRMLMEALALSEDERVRFEGAARRASSQSRAKTIAADADLPLPATPLFGRDDQVASIVRLLGDPDVRLLTLTGPGGVGKTRLALEVAARMADRFAGGAVFVPLAPLREAGLLPDALARALAFGERSGQTLLESVTTRLRPKQMLLLLDNFEHLLDAAPVVAELLAACPRLTVLATSRSPLHLSVERQFPVPPLVLPDATTASTAEALARSPAVALFVQRARSVAPDFELTPANTATVAAICWRLDGLPLAIELGASWIKVLPPHVLLARLERALPMLAGGPRDAPERHRTLRDAIAWSSNLLSSRQQALLRRLSVFVDGCTLEAVETVASHGDDATRNGGQSSPGTPPTALLSDLAALVDASLLQATATDPNAAFGIAGVPRYTMLETIREYAAELLAASGEEATVQSRHAAYYLGLVEQAQAQLVGPQEAVWLARLEEERANLRAALRWSLDRREADMAVRFAAVLWRFWASRGHFSEGREWLEEILALARATPAADDAPPEAGIAPLRLAMLLHVTAILARVQGDYARAQPMYEECLAIRRARDDQRGVVAALHNLGITAYEQGDYAQAVRCFEEALPLARAIDETYGTAIGLASLGDAVRALGDLRQARERYEESLALFTHIGHIWGIALALTGLGDASYDQGDMAQAAKLYRESLTLSGQIGDRRSVAEQLERLARVKIVQSDGPATLKNAALLLGAAATLRDQLGVPRPPILQDTYEQSVAAARSALGDGRFEAAWAGGEQLTLEQVLDTALQLDAPATGF